MMVRLFLLVLFNFTLLTVFGLEKPSKRQLDVFGPSMKIIGDERPVFIRIPPPAFYTNKSASLVNGAKITVTYSGFSSEAKTVFQEAVAIWSGLIQSPVEIQITAYWRELTGTTLGSCGPTNYYQDYDGMPYASTYYPISLAEKLTGEELNNSGNADMVAYFNSTASWYYGTDGNTPANKYDLLTAVMHEIGHGLGFYGSLSVSNDRGSWGWGSSSPFIFDLYLHDSDRNQLVNPLFYPNHSVTLKNALTNGEVYFEGALIESELGSKVTMYSPSEWEEGSSIYHLSPVYASSTNGLMTSTLNKGKSVHNPGLFTLGILDEMGWKQIRIEHQPEKNSEEIKDATISARITADFQTQIENPKMYFSTDKTTYSSLNMKKIANDTTRYEAIIPISSSANVSYYLTANDKYGRTFKIPVNSPNEGYAFFAGPDTISPTIKHYPVNFLLPDQNAIQFTAKVTDAFGIDSVWIEYWFNGGKVAKKAMQLTTNSEYTLPLNISHLNVAAGDSIHYRIAANDMSKAGNKGYYPRTGTERILVEALPEYVETLENDFETNKNDFLLSGFEIIQPVGFLNRSLNTPHPYEFAGEGNFIEYLAQIRYPILVKSENHFISFDEIVLAEPGEEGAAYGDDEFWDYAVVEASNDRGNSWSPLEPGWDCRLDESWELAYNRSIIGQFSQSVGNPSMYRNHIIDLSGSGAIRPGDTILLRFRFYSDPYANGWGWSVDNLKIQSENVNQSTLTTSKTINIFPNPVTDGSITIESKSSPVRQITIVNLQGAIVMKKTLNNSENWIKLPEELRGLYLIFVKTDRSSANFRIVIK